MIWTGFQTMERSGPTMRRSSACFLIFFLFFFDLKVVIVPKQIEEGVTLIQHWPIHVNS